MGKVSRISTQINEFSIPSSYDNDVRLPLYFKRGHDVKIVGSVKTWICMFYRLWPRVGPANCPRCSPALGRDGCPWNMERERRDTNNFETKDI